MKNHSGKGSKSGIGVAIRRDRKSNTGMLGSPKKGGRGGKFTWDGDGYSRAELGLAEKDTLDAKDPNFQDPELAPQ